MLRNGSIALAALSLFAISSTALAQTNVQWVTYTNDSATRLPGLTSVISNSTTESDLDAGDLDLDGWLDIVVVRKQPSSEPGKKSNLVLLNNINGNGAFTNVTATKANTSTFVGSSGMLDLTDDRDVDVADFNNDGLLDWITTTTLSDGDPKWVSHPRVYKNLGFAPDSSWIGAIYQETAIPTLISNGGVAAAPRFCEADTGDVDENGFLDVYFIDYDGTETGWTEIGNEDFNDRLLLNDGAGNFNDTTNANMKSSQRASTFGVSCVLADFNGDTHVDILKDTTLNNPIDVRLIYNNPLNIGHFDQFNGANQDFQSMGPTQPYGINNGDLNNDGKEDIVFSDDGNDRYALNTGNDAFGKAMFPSLGSFQFVSTAHDDGFANDVYLFDLDNDGWKDVIITDFDKDLTGCGRRTHIYHNTTPHTVGGTVTLKEEAQATNGTGWKGVVGPVVADLKGVYDVLVRDFDNDGDLDIIIVRCGGTFYWTNTKNSYVCQTDMAFGNGGGTVTSCGGTLTAGRVSVMELSGAPANGIAHLFGGFSWTPTLIPGTGGGMLGPFVYAIYVPLPINGQGGFNITVPGGGVPGPTSLYVQMLTTTNVGGNPRFTNGVKLDLVP